MERGVGSIWCLVLLIPGLLPGCWSQVTVEIDGYTHNSTLTSGGSVPLGTQIILVCQVVGLPYGTPLIYTWTCPNGPCEVEGYYGRTVHNEHILAVNTTSTNDEGTYTCQVTATGGQEATEAFRLTVTGGDIVHSYGRLIPHEFPITDLIQISGPDGIGRINCTVNSGKARFVPNGGQLEGGGVSQTRNGTTATLVVKPSNVGSFQNRQLFCSNFNNFFYLFISNANPLSIPNLVVYRAQKSAVKYQVQSNDDLTDALITGYEVIRFGVPMIGQYVNTGRGSRVTISPAVPCAQYRITAWALGDGRRSATPAVEYATARETTTTATEVATEGNAAPSSGPLLPAVVFLVVVVLLVIICVALLALALAVTVTKLNKLKKMKGHSYPLHCYNKTAVGEGETKIYDEVGKIYDEVGKADPIEGQSGPYQELTLETMEKRQYESLHKDTTANV